MKDLSGLENRFFEHTYAQDTVNDRLDRLEKMVFGETKQGTSEERIASLMAALPDPENDPTQAPPQSTSAGSDGSTDSSGQSASSTVDNQPSGDHYPRVDALETAMLGSTYQNEPIRQRLDQLELKAFGKQSTTLDLSDRVDRLEQYAERKHLGNYAAADNNEGYRYPRQNPAVSNLPEPPPNAPIEAKVTWLEMQVLGQSNPHKPMIDRLRPLERAMFPTDPADIHASIPEQVNMLMGAVELLNKQQAGAAPADQDLSIRPLLSSANGGPAYSPQSTYNGGGNPAYANSYGGRTVYPQSQYSQQGYTQQGYNAGYGNQQGYQSTNQSSQPGTTSSTKQSRGHPLLRGLAHVLGEVGQMAVGSMSSGMMMGSPYGYGFGAGYPTAGVFGWP
ncbi:MAG TPA: hypothetical protein V6D17_19655 [Candidatus Obscuribacterales bacterium]